MYRKAGVVCAALDCKNKSYNCKLKFFCFPKDERARVWAILCGRNDLLLDKAKRLYQYKLCVDHFELRMFNNSELRTKLKANAYPTIFAASTSRSSIVLNEHSYCVQSVAEIKKEVQSSRFNEHSYARPSELCMKERFTIANNLQQNFQEPS